MTNSDVQAWPLSMVTVPAADLIRPSWCDRPSIEVAPDLLGCTLARQLADGSVVRSTIVETEAYAPGDPACHAYRGKRPRNASMFGPPGHSYVYLIYGMYHCLNVVTEAEGIGSAVLIRAIALKTIPPFLQRQLNDQLSAQQMRKPHRIAAGPGKLCRALSIDRRLDGVLYGPSQGLWLEHGCEPVDSSRVVQTTRVGISKAVERPWRWYLKDSPAVSKP